MSIIAEVGWAFSCMLFGAAVYRHFRCRLPSEHAAGRSRGGATDGSSDWLGGSSSEPPPSAERKQLHVGGDAASANQRAPSGDGGELVVTPNNTHETEAAPGRR